MKTVLAIALCLSLAASPALGYDAEAPAPHDGDTMYVAPSAETPACSRLRQLPFPSRSADASSPLGHWESIRILGLDAPEMDGDCPTERRLAEAARARLIKLLASGRVSIERNGCDRYQRTLGAVSVDGRDVAAVLIAEGLARPYDGGRRRSWCGE